MPEPPLSRFEVRDMIHTELSKYDEKQESRHTANIERMDHIEKRIIPLDAKLNRIIGALLLIGALIPLITHLLSKL